MTTASVSLNTIEEFLRQKRIAIIGISRQSQNIGIEVFNQLRRRGHDVFPVNPNAVGIMGHHCYSRVQEIQPPPDAALVMTPARITSAVVRDCAEAGIRLIWMFRGGGQGSVSPEAVEFCHANGIDLVPGECPLMFLAPVNGIHWIHRLICKITRSYPKRMGNKLLRIK